MAVTEDKKNEIVEQHVMAKFSKMVRAAHMKTTDHCVYSAPFPFKTSKNQPSDIAEILWEQKEDIIELFKLLD